MAIIPCRECAHQVSDQAASCPSCGAPIKAAVKSKPRVRQRVSRVLIALMTLWTLGTLVWLILPSRAPDEWIARARLALHRFDGSTGHPSHAAAQIQTAQSSAATVHTGQYSGGPESPTQPALAPRPVYRTTAEQLYRAYEANAVAVQTSIGGSLVRVTGSVAEIDQDATGHPVVQLWTGKDSTAAMTLAVDQRAAAAQLIKGESVAIECDRIGGSGAVPQGSDCSLAFVDLRTREVNLALFLANDRGAARVYVVGPMPETVCQERGEEISSRLRGKQRGEHVVWRNCTEATRESILPEGCRPTAPSVTVPDVPAAHLWRYDCGSSNGARTASHRSTPGSSQGNAAIVATTTTAEPADATAAVGQAAPAPPPAKRVAANNIHLASSAGRSDTGAATATPDDLTSIRAVDPQAANHITGYCSKTPASANRDTYTADCRREEIAAWRRLVLQNEFPTLDDATRMKCSEPPFPDTYVAKESCARYELHKN